MPIRLITAALATGLVALAVGCNGPGSVSPPSTPSPIAQPTSDPEGPAGLRSVYFVDAQRGWASGYLGGERGGAILGTTDGGRTWQRQYADAQSIYGLDFVSSLIGWALMLAPRASEQRATVLSTTDGGQTWRSLGDSGKFLLDVDFVSPTLGWAADRSGPAFILARTEDGGRTWMAVEDPPSAQSVCFGDAGHGWVAAGSRVWRTGDGGRTWTAAFEAPAVIQAQRAAVECLGSDIAWVTFTGPVGMFHAVSAVYRTVDGGVSWEPVLADGSLADKLRVPVAAGAVPGPTGIAGKGTALFVGGCEPCRGYGQAFIQRTEDGGQTWQSGVVPDALAHISDIAFPGAGHGWAVGTYVTESNRLPYDLRQEAVILTSTDGGQSWVKQYPRSGSP